MTRWMGYVREKKGLVRAADKVIRRWQNMCLAPGFSALKQRAVQLKAMRLAGSKVVLRWQRLGLWRGFIGWSEHASRQRRMALAATQQAQFMAQLRSRGIWRSNRIQLAVAFDAFSGTVFILPKHEQGAAHLLGIRLTNRSFVHMLSLSHHGAFVSCSVPRCSLLLHDVLHLSCLCAVGTPLSLIISI